MPTWTALTTTDGEPSATALGAAMEELLDPAPTGIGVFEIEDGSGRWEVGGYFLERPDTAALTVLATVHGARDFSVSRVEDRDWVAQVRRELHPIEAGRFIVYGPHDAASIPPNRPGLMIEAAMAFGTGHHGTTQGCLVMLDHLLRHGLKARRVADIGCGTGVLGMAAARVWRVPVICADIDPVASATARANAVANHLHPWVRTGTAAGFRGTLAPSRAPYDLVFANILAAPLKRLAPQIARHLVPGGRAVLSGLLHAQVPGVEAVFRGHGFTPEKRVRLDAWSTLLMRRGG
ncbi:50S ribosomal protein L11 methyltransferase [Limibaculum sp. M0105]|uniref:Ribosomal protein L11 methyltransferase n=1 Tax=Thermohalobaculum xanthum TaxID=2753746 RepID=A0A8J7M6T0_9RHOB|nr:50S ribosomal protein L11 methyltransferase [Thermohalobaculum xanthum]MBK0399338.1 50S ribosomal protein L11 methyltransferase [Thermohalobaculum xanthum]